jgi:hypothetical protein
MWLWSTASVVCIGLIATLSCTQSATALTMRECSVKYKAAQASGTLGGLTWQQFRKANCGPGTPTTTTGSPGTGSAALSPGATFPQAVSPKYTNESAGKARYTRASINTNTGPTRLQTPTVVFVGSLRAGDITASATSD